jgi:hypothetical protein
MTDKQTDALREAFEALAVKCAGLDRGAFHVIKPQLQALRDALAQPAPEPDALQPRVGDWLHRTFDPDTISNRTERVMRFLEEAMELGQALGIMPDQNAKIAEYVYGRPVGEPHQEVGGTMITLAALCHVFGLDMLAEGERELARIDTPEMRAKIAAKQVSKRMFGMTHDTLKHAAPEPMTDEALFEMMAAFQAAKLAPEPASEAASGDLDARYVTHKQLTDAMCRIHEQMARNFEAFTPEPPLTFRDRAAQGKAYLLKLSDGGQPEQFRTVAGLRRQEPEAPDLFVGVGVFTGSQAELQIKAIKAIALRSTRERVELSFEDGERVRGLALFREVQFLGDGNGEATYRISLHLTEVQHV